MTRGDLCLWSGIGIYVSAVIVFANVYWREIQSDWRDFSDWLLRVVEEDDDSGE